MRWIRTVGVGLAFAASACGDGGGDASGSGSGPPAGGGPAEVVRIGVAGPVTGAQAKNGKDLVDGTTMAVEEWNAKGGVLGRRLEVVVRDDEARAEKASSVANELVDAKVAGVVGHFNSACTFPASEIYKRGGVVMITPASTNPSITDRNYATVFRVCGRDDDQGRAAADFIVDGLGAKKVAVLDDRTAYGKALADFVVQSLGDRVQVVVREGFAEDERNFRPYLAKVKESGAEVWYFGGIYSQAVPLLNQAKQVGVTAPMMSGDGVHGYDEDFIAKLGAAAEGVFTTFANTESAPGYKDWLARYQERFKGRPGPYAVYSYCAATVLLNGIRDAGTTDAAKVAESIRAKPHDTAAGSIEFDAKGDPKAFYTRWVIRGGKHVLHPSVTGGK